MTHKKTSFQENEPPSPGTDNAAHSRGEYSHLVLESNRQIQEIMDLLKKVEALEIIESSHREELSDCKQHLHTCKSNLKRAELECAVLKDSISFKIGQTFVSAVKQPGLNTLLLPYYFFKVIVEEALTHRAT